MSSAADNTPAKVEQDTHFAAGRYRVDGPLGRGGMAAVYAVTDAVSERRCALKRLILPQRVEYRRTAVALFEREFLTLSQLQHPHVVSAFDYGVDAGTPYYTMELVAGSDLQARVPLPWPSACAVARDLCSVFSLIHSRRMVYRDLGPRNVRCGEGGATKLIDFGAMAPMGPSRQLIGTPAFCAPEAVLFQPLDARTDLYSLGATLYFMLLGRVPYQARDFAQLRQAWRTRPGLPSQYVPDIPNALDQLVMELLQLEPSLRPANAAEVFERLGAIAELPAHEQLAVPQAYLSTPSLVGRSAELDRVREILGVACAGARGTSVLLRGATGSGRSRLLAACVLEAKLLGATVLRADAGDGRSHDYGVARVLAQQLLETAPEPALSLATPLAGVLAHVVPELLDRIPDLAPAAIDPQELAQHVLPALRQWLLDVSKLRPIVIAVDDVHRIDESSAAFLALLAHALDRGALAIIATSDDSVEPLPYLAASLKLLTGASTLLAVVPLEADATQQLLGSVFGEVPNLQLLAHCLQQISGGNPRDLMQLGQHLVDKGLIRYRGGSWSLPADLDTTDLPSGMAQALRARVDMLGDHARLLAQTMAHAPDRQFGFDECLMLAKAPDAVHLMQSLDELLAAGVLRLEGERYALSQRGWVPALCDALDASAREAMHARLADLFAALGDGLREAQHLLRAGLTDRGLDAIVVHSRVSRERTDGNVVEFLEFLRSLPDDWFAIYEQALALCEERGRPRAQIYVILSRVCGLLGATTANAGAFFEALIGELSRNCGLDVYATLDPALPAMQRLQTALETARQRHAQAAPEHRVVEPLAALQQLARAVVQVASSIALGFDYDRVKRLPSLEPLYPLSPAFTVVDRLMQGVETRITGRAQRALEIYSALLERLAQPDRSGLDASHHLYTVSGVQCGMGMLEATMGLNVCLERAASIERYPQHHVNAVMLRMLYHLWQGDSRAAEQHKRAAELIRIQGTQRRNFDGVHVLGEVTAYALSGDLTGVKQATAEIEELSQRFPGWVPVLHFARGEYQRLRGNSQSALAEIEAALRLVEADRHQAWVHIAAAHVRVLRELGRHEEARAHGEHYLSAAERAQLGYARAYLKMPLSLALASCDEHAQAAAVAHSAIDDFTSLGTTGLNLVVAYEARARVAIRAGDQQAFAHFATCLAQHIPAGSARTLLASYERTLKEARATGLHTPGEAVHAASSDADAASMMSLRSVLDPCPTLSACARAGLELLVRGTGSRAGLLYAIERGRPELHAGLGDLEPSPAIDALVRDYVADELTEDQVTQQELAANAITLGTSAVRSHWTQANGDALRPILIAHEERGGPVITGVVVLLPARAFRSPALTISEVSRALSRIGRQE